MTLHSPTENSLGVLNHKILEANSQVQNVKLGGHQTCLSINRLWHELCDMLRRLVGTTAPGHPDCFNSGNEKLVIMALYRSPLTVTLWLSSFLKKYGPMIPPAHKAHQTNDPTSISWVAANLSDPEWRNGLSRVECCQVIYSQFGLAIHQNDHQARRRFVEWAQNDFHKRILFSDEAHFWLNGYVNKQNCRIWSEANPQVYVETPLHPEKLTVSCALWAGGILLQKR
ncbi:uncharacterized protein TNCV_715551 [Trichonephila clavipes]|nr:uncharacterized protein TNCV_715551 [Trichonephila clavipes]